MGSLRKGGGFQLWRKSCSIITRYLTSKGRKNAVTRKQLFRRKSTFLLLDNFSNPCRGGFNSHTVTLFHSSFVSKNVIYSENIHYAYNFYGADMFENVCRGAFRTQSNKYDGVSS